MGKPERMEHALQGAATKLYDVISDVQVAAADLLGGTVEMGPNGKPAQPGIGRETLTDRMAADWLMRRSAQLEQIQRELERALEQGECWTEGDTANERAMRRWRKGDD